jgi:hypothetical protein
VAASPLVRGELVADMIVNDQIILELKAVESGASRTQGAAPELFARDRTSPWLVDQLQRSGGVERDQADRLLTHIVCRVARPDRV